MDVYVAGGVDGSCVLQSTGGSSGGADGAGFSAFIPSICSLRSFPSPPNTLPYMEKYILLVLLVMMLKFFTL